MNRSRSAAKRAVPWSFRTEDSGVESSPSASAAVAPALLRAMRPQQWIKNGVVFAALVFAHRLGDPTSLARSVAAALAFCALSSAMYLLNDVRDAPQDRLHPIKRFRPIAAGELTSGMAVAAAVALLAVASILSVGIGRGFVLVGAGYVALMVAYSWGLKALAIVDVMVIATGFTLRAVAGAVAIGVAISPWLLVCATLLALLIGFGKRRHELATLDNAGAHRSNLNDYTLPMLDQLIAVSAASVVVAYGIYSFDAPNVPRSHAMVLTAPLVLYAVLRYLFLLHARGEGGSPEALLLRDRPLAVAVAAWGLASIAILYWGG